MEQAFCEYWVEVKRLHALPEMAIKQLPNSLSADTKKKPMNLKTTEAVKILTDAINTVNCGSIESINNLVSKMLQG